MRNVDPDALKDSGLPFIQSSIQTLNILFKWEMHNGKSLLQNIKIIRFYSIFK